MDLLTRAPSPSACSRAKTALTARREVRLADMADRREMGEMVSFDAKKYDATANTMTSRTCVCFEATMTKKEKERSR